MDTEQRKYLLERIRNEYNNVVEPIKQAKNKNKNPRAVYPTREEAEFLLSEYSLNNQSRFFQVYYSNGQMSITFTPKPVEENKSKVDYDKIILKLNTEKNKVLDEIMLGDLADAGKLLLNFIKFLQTEKEKLNVN